MTILSLSVSISYSQSLKASYTKNAASECGSTTQPVTVLFTDNSTGATSIEWDFGNGITSSEKEAALAYVPGTYTVSLTATDGSKTDTYSETFTIYENPVAQFTLSDDFTGCVATNFTFNESSESSASISSYTWSFGDGTGSIEQNPSHTYTAEGKYTVGLTITDVNGCSSSRIWADTIQVSKKLMTSFIASEQEACKAPLTTTFTPTISNGTAVSCFWDFGDGSSSTDVSPSHTYTADGSYNVTFSAMTETGCTTSMTESKYININTFDIDIAVNSAACENTPISFGGNANSTMGTWNWDFGDGETSSEQNPTKTYSSAGDYTVILTGTSALGCVKEKSLSLTVSEQPSVAFSADKTGQCAPDLNATFTDNSANAKKWLWNFGDGATSTEQNPSHTYTAEGKYTVSLELTDNNGCSNKQEITDYIIIQNPTASFSVSSDDGTYFCTGATITITDNSESAFGGLEYVWSFNYDAANEDTRVQNGQNWDIQYNTAGEYEVVLTITDAKGCTNTYTDIMKVGAKPTTPVVVTQDACYKDGGDFTATSSSNVDNWYWDFGTGEEPIIDSVGETSIQNHLFPQPDTYTVTVISKQYSCPSDAVEQQITIKAPRAEFTFDPLALCSFPTEVTFSPIDSVDAVTYEWDFANGEKIKVEKISDGVYTWTDMISNTVIHDNYTEYKPQVTYTTPDSYTVTLKTTADECTDEKTNQLDMSGMILGFTQDTIEICKNEAVTFADTSKPITGSISTRTWKFFNSTISEEETGEKPSHTFTTDGVYIVRLIAENSLGCVDSITKPMLIKVNPLPTITDFYPSKVEGCAPLEVKFTPKAEGSSEADIAAYKWTFGDGNTSEETIGVNTYSTGVYDVTLTVTDTKNCSSDSTKTKYITAAFPTPKFSVPTAVCAYNDITPKNTSTGIDVTYSWNFGDGSVKSTEMAPTYSYKETAITDTTFTIKLTATDKYGCTDSYEQSIAIRCPISDFEAAQTFYTCPPASVVFTNNSQGTDLTYSWDFFDGSLPSNQKDAFWQYFISGVYDVRLIVEDDLGCTDTLHRQEYITVKGPRGKLVVDKTKACLLDSIHFTAEDLHGATGMTWVFGDSRFKATEPIEYVDYAYTEGNEYTPTLLLTDDSGCKVPVLGSTITVYGVELSFDVDSILCEPSYVVINNTSKQAPVDADSWKWIFSTGDTLTTKDAALNLDYGTFDMSLIATSGGCEYRLDTSQFIQILRTLDAQFTTDQNPAKIMETVTFTNTTDTAYGYPVFTFWDYGTGATSDDFNGSYSFMNSGDYEVVLTTYIHEECPGTYSLPITILKDYLIPNVFTPNGDNVNDYFLEDMPEIELIIINRWGQKLYEGYGGWDGTSNGQEMSAGTYFYMITMPDGEKFEGSLMLIRN